MSAPQPRDAGSLAGASTALLTDRYELTMLRGALHSGTAGRQCVFEVFARSLPHGRRYGVVAGTGRLLDALEAFRFGPGELDWLAAAGVIDDPTRDWLAAYRFTGDIWGYGEGECYLPGSPLLVVSAPFGEAVLLETLVLSILNHDSAVAAAASRMAGAAGDRPCIEMGSRRTAESAALAAARAAYVAGFAGTSNLAAGRAYGIPTTGTSAHAFVLLHDSEAAAFRAQVATLGKDTTLLVDTYDVPAAVALAVEVAGPGLGAVRIDSGDLIQQAHEVRAQLDRLGATATGIVVSGDLDEHAIAALMAAPVSSYGVGTALVVGSGAPTSNLVYKLVARAQQDGPDAPLVPVAKRSVGKPSRGGGKLAMRRRGADGTATAEVVVGVAAGEALAARVAAAADTAAGAGDLRPLLVPLVRGGEVVGREPLTAARARHAASVAELPARARQLSRGEPAIPTSYVTGPADVDTPTLTPADSG